jgi:drug/metabolite transporter (DMT)-like permease
MTFDRWPALPGALIALLAATLFGVSTPFVQLAGRGLGPFATSALLYGGAGLVGMLSRRPAVREAALRRSDGARLLSMVLFGAVAAPVALTWGLQHTSGTSASLMLVLEALFTALLARLLYRETMGLRLWFAMLLLFAGGVLLILDRAASGDVQMLGIVAVLGATAAWGIDNTLSRALAERDPGQLVMAKAATGAIVTGLIAIVVGEPLPTLAACTALLAIGASGYGLSLRLYLLAQRAFGAARTGSVFAFAPFIGASVAVALGDRSLTWGVAAAGLLMLAGVAFHLFETHEHEHQHEALEHEHSHTHDDGHHDHTHADAPDGPHSHPHRHAPLRHAHRHVPDVHHAHVHDT